MKEEMNGKEISAASIIFIAGQEIKMPPNIPMLIYMEPKPKWYDKIIIAFKKHQKR